jgi:hypothetical protein
MGVAGKKIGVSLCVETMDRSQRWLWCPRHEKLLELLDFILWLRRYRVRTNGLFSVDNLLGTTHKIIWHQENGMWGSCYSRLIERPSSLSRPQEPYRSNVHFADALTNGETGVGTGGATLEFHSIKCVLPYYGCRHDH